MRRILFAAALVLAAAPWTSGQTPDRQAKPAGERVAAGGVEQALIKLDRELADAALRNDTTLLERTAADDYVSINPVGVIGDKAQAVAGAKSAKFESLNTEDVKVRLFGDTAVVTGRATVKGQFSGQDISGQYRYMRVFTRQQGQWKAVAFQVTPIAQQPSTQQPAEKKP